MISEKDKLANYDDALSGLEVDDQMEKVSAVRSPVTVRRALSADAPEGLVRRFSTRINEVLENMDYFEAARVYSCLEQNSEALLCCKKALAGGDGRGNLLMAELTDDPGEVLPHLREALKFEDSVAVRDKYGLYCMMNGQEEEARGHFRAALVMVGDKGSKTGLKGDREYFEGLLNRLDGHEKGGLAAIGRAADLGNVRALVFLEKYYHGGNGNESGNLADVDELPVIFAQMARNGFWSELIELGVVLSANGDEKEALKCYRQAMTAGHLEAYALMLVLLMKVTRDEDPEKLNKLIENLPKVFLKDGDARMPLLQAINSFFQCRKEEMRSLLMEAMKSKVVFSDSFMNMVLGDGGDEGEGRKDGGGKSAN